MTVISTFPEAGHSKDRESQYLCDTGRRYSRLNFHKASWDQINSDLSQLDWGEFNDIVDSCPTQALGIFHKNVLQVLERLIPEKLVNKRPKSKLDRRRKLIWKRLSKVRKEINRCKSSEKTAKLLEKMWSLESQLNEDYTAVNKREEDEAVMRIKSNPKYFFSFAKKRKTVKSRVGPFLDENGRPNPSLKFTVEALKKQYESVFSQPRPEWQVSDCNLHFCAAGNNSERSPLNDVIFGVKDIELACRDLKESAASGPDGVPAVFLKKCCQNLINPLFKLWRSSLNHGVIPEELLLVLICPVYKGGSKAIPKNYRPVALTSHIMKVFERIVRAALVKHVESNGILPDGQHGSRARRSTLTQLLKHWDYILDGLEAGPGVDCVYLDFAKAYDKVETGVLLHKLKEVDVLGKAGCWLAAFLDSRHRKQAVVVDGEISGLSAVVSGIPRYLHLIIC